MTARVGSLFSGYGGLDLGLMSVIDCAPVWHCEFDEAPSKVLDHHWPGVPNFGDVSAVDWATVEPVDILTGGFPCQDVSLAGRRAGMKEGTRSGLWSEFAKAIDVLRPGLVVIENVRGLLSAAAGGDVESCAWCLGDDSGEPALRALGAVLGELADLGYDAEWTGVRASVAGAPHGRFRVFVVAYPGGGRDGWGAVASGDGEVAGADVAVDGSDFGAHWASVADTEREPGGERWPAASGEAEGGRSFGVDRGLGARTHWGEYEPAIRRWEHATSRLAPSPTIADGRDGQHRLSAPFVEWMMGLAEGWVTASEIGLTRNQQLRALGNGVVPQQAALALRDLLGVAS